MDRLAEWRASALAQLARERYRRCEIALHVQNVKNGDPVGDKIELQKWLKQLLTHAGPATALVHGVAGSGKSSALTSAAEVLWQKCDLQEDGALVPIFVSLPALRDPVTMAIDETLEAWGFSRRNIEELLRSKYRFVILLDAVDEVKEKHRQRHLAATNRLDRWGTATIVLFSARTEMSTGCDFFAQCPER